MLNEDKIKFFEEKIIQKKEIAGFHFNDVWCEYADKFHTKPNGKHKTIMADFKNYLKFVCQHNDKVELVINKVDYIDRTDFGVLNIWSEVYK